LRELNREDAEKPGWDWVKKNMKGFAVYPVVMLKIDTNGD